MQIVYKRLDEIKPYKNNPRKNEKAVLPVMESIKNFGFRVPIIIDDDNVIVAGHTRYEASKRLGLTEVPTISTEGLTKEQIKAFRIVDNKTNEFATWDEELLKIELEDLDIDLDFDLLDLAKYKEQKEIIEDDFDIVVPEVPKAKLGDIYQLGKHRLMCGDSTVEEDVKGLMGGVVADMVFTDPPYGMKKENKGVLNDNLNYDNLLEFNKKWIPLTFNISKENGSWYCWGTDEPLMDIYSEILKPMMRENKITFRNLLTWDKGNGQGQNAEEFRMYPIADEKCLFIQVGIQALTLNADQYWEEYEPIRKYLYDSRISMGWDVPTMKRIVGHSDLSRDHWTSKSQFNMPTREVYEKMQKAAETQRKEKGINNDAFRREYDDLRREYDDLRREYDDLRAYFDNTHDNQNNVWHFDRTSNEEKELTGGHATPKPIALCGRAIKSSSKEDEIVVDLFGGSGSTLIACEQLDRNCYMMELDPKYVDVIIERWEKFTGNKAVKL